MPSRKTLMLLLFIFIYGTMGLMYRPLVPLYLDELEIEPFMVGLTLAAYPVIPALLSLWASKVIGWLQIRQLLMAGTAMVAIGCVALGLSENLVVISLGHMISGTSTMMVVVASQSYIYQVSRPHMVARNFALLVGSFSLADILGPSLGGSLARMVGFQQAFLLISLGAIGAWMVSLSFGREKIKQPSNVRVSWSLARQVLSSPQYVLSLVIVVAAITILTLTLSFYPLHLSRLGYSAQMVGLFLSFRGLGQLASPLGMAFLERRIGRSGVFIGASILSLASLLLIPLVASPGPLLVISMLLGCSFGLMIPISLVSATEGSTADTRVFALGMRFAFNRTMDALGPVIFGAGVQMAGLTAPFYITALMVGAVLVVVYSRRRYLEARLDARA